MSETTASPENPPLAPLRERHALTFVVVTIFIDAMGFGFIMPVLPRLLMRVGQLDLAQAIDISTWMGLGTAVAAFMAAPFLGNLSDAYGRRIVLLVAVGGLAANYFLLAISDSLTLLIVSRIFTGFFGGSFGPAQAAIADITRPEDRARNFGKVGAAFGVGFVVGPALGGLLATFGQQAPFYGAFVLALANFLYGLFVFPETLALANRRSFKFSRANPLGAFRAAQAIPGMLRAALVLLLWQVAGLVYPQIWSFWCIAQLGWSDRMIGFSLGLVGLAIATSQMCFTGLAVRKLGERGAATLGITLASTGFVAYAFTSSGVIALLLIICVAGQALIQPSLMAIMSRRATERTQGEVQGIAAMSTGFAAMLAPLVFNKPMAWFTSDAAPVYFPGVAFAIAACFGIAAVITLRTMPRATAYRPFGVEPETVN